MYNWDIFILINDTESHYHFLRNLNFQNFYEIRRIITFYRWINCGLEDFCELEPIRTKTIQPSLCYSGKTLELEFEPDLFPIPFILCFSEVKGKGT